MQKLPEVLPVFRVRSTILMPHAQLPIIVPETDYLSIASEVMESNIVAIIQPKPIFMKGARNKELIKSFSTGCAGKITDISFIGEEITINIYGLCRFETIQKLPVDHLGIERVSVSYEKFLIDMENTESTFNFDKNRLMNALDIYFKNLEISPNWTEIEKTPPDILISALAMACPFHPSEKQSLLETVDIKERSDMITRIIEMNSFDRYNTASAVN
jgi:Lon protease-like protein